ncbi:MAG: helix-turn-helix domain-containing protein [Chloroflexota bacterium]
MASSTARAFYRFECTTPELPTLGESSSMPDLADYMTTEDAAQILGFHIDHVRRMLREGDLQGEKISGKTWLVYRPSVKAYQEKTSGLNKFDPRRGNEENND